MRFDIVPGSVLPDYVLPDHTDTARRLSELQGDELMILLLSRGHYCPEGHQQHLELAHLQPKVAVAYTQLVTVTTRLRGAWDAGDYSPFHGWDRHTSEQLAEVLPS